MENNFQVFVLIAATAQSTSSVGNSVLDKGYSTEKIWLKSVEKNLE